MRFDVKVRLAELRDLPELREMFLKLIAYVKDCGQWALSDNPADVENGAMAFLLSKMTHEDNVVLVTSDEEDRANGFLAGWIMNYPSFYQHQKVAEIQFLYPLSFDRAAYLRDAFDIWGKARGATAVSNYATPGNGASIRVMKRDGRKLVYQHFMRPYEV